jgi:outer membrane biosynthesis protein TonB
LFIAGCPKRQGPLRIVYVPAPPAAAASSSSTPPQTLVIEEPEPPPAPEKATVPEVTHTESKTVHPHRRILRTEPPPAAAATTEPPPVEAPEAPPAEVPALAPHESSAQESALRSQIQSLQGSVRQRLAQLNEAKLSDTDRKTLEDARGFFAQSGRALEEGDLQRALTLGRKASLLLSALEQAQ